MAIDIGSAGMGVANTGMAAASGNYIGAAIDAIGLGMQIFGGSKSADIAKQQAQVSQDEAVQERGINNLKQRQMELEAGRQNVQQIRTAQQAAALATSRATNQGAQFGSGLQGGLAGVTAGAEYNMLGVNQALGIGRGINSYNQNISKDRMQMASLGGDAATAQGMTSMGGAVMKAGPIVGQLSQGFNIFGNKPYSMPQAGVDF